MASQALLRWLAIPTYCLRHRRRDCEAILPLGCWNHRPLWCGAGCLSALNGCFLLCSAKYFQNMASEFISRKSLGYNCGARWSSLVARWAHNPKVGGSNPSRATRTPKASCRAGFFVFLRTPMLACASGAEWCSSPWLGECYKNRS